MRAGRVAVWAAIVVVGVASWSRGEWAPPADNRLTDKQMQAYVGAMHDMREMWKQQGKKIENASSPRAWQVAAQAGERWSEILKKHGLSEEEWNWVNEQALRIWMVNEMLVSAEQDLEKQKQAINDRIAAEKRNLAEQEAELKAGKRTLSDEDRKSASDDFKQQQAGALEEAKGHDEAAKAAAEEAKQYDAEAGESEKAMKAPPANLTAEERQSHADEKKAEAQQARERAKEARAREAESKQAAADARKSADRFAKQAADPTLVLDPDEQASLKERHQLAIDATKATIAREEESLNALAPYEAQHKELMGQMKQGIPDENLQLIRKYRDQVAAVFTGDEKKSEPAK